MNKIFINSLPKSGTHLINKYINNIGYAYSGISMSSMTVNGRYRIIKKILKSPLGMSGGIDLGLEINSVVSNRWVEKSIKKLQRGEYIGAHIPYSEEIYDLLMENDLKIIHLLRDPRDVLLSWVLYVKQSRWHPGYIGIKNCDLETAIKKVMAGYVSNNYYIFPFHIILNKSNGWLSADLNNVHILRYENIVGSQGGGSDLLQDETILKLNEYLGYESHASNKVIEHLYGNTNSFRKGKIGGWKDEISAELQGQIDVSLKKHIIEMGYV